jgi:UDP-4-amino-4,6-dideoxy-N-acetyl-beta-L-altrosamine transaminase
MIPYGRQSIDEGDIAAVVEVLRASHLTQGPMVPRFEQAMARRVGAGYGVAVNSATSALHIACLALGLGPGDLLWTVPNTFVASANAGRYCGADVDFVDIDARTYNMDPAKLEAKLVAAAAQGRRPKVVIPVHFAGQGCDMARIHALSQAFGFKIVEDASHAVGADYEGRPIGDGRYADITVFSFHPVKIITTGEGGMAMTKDPDLAAHMARLRSHGVTRDTDLMGHMADGPWAYAQVELGLNYRMTDIQAALGLSQLARLDAMLDRRRRLAARYDRLLADLPVLQPWQDPQTNSSWHLYVVGLPEHLDRRGVFEAMHARGVGVQVHYIPVHTQPYYQALGFRRGDYPVAERYYARSFSLPIFPDLTDDDQDRVVEALQRSLALAASGLRHDRHADAALAGPQPA